MGEPPTAASRPVTDAPAAADRSTAAVGAGGRGSSTAALSAAVLGFFVITLDALVVGVALPTVGDDLGGGTTGLAWVVDGYVLAFAALLLSAGALSDRIGARRAFAVGMAVFVLASAGCGLAPDLGVLVLARAAQGAGAAAMTPSSLSLIREAFTDPVERGRAIAVWTITGSVAAALGPLVGGSLNLVSWRLIFLVNLPVGLVALVLLRRAARSPRRPAPFDAVGQVSAVVAMTALVLSVIEAGTEGVGTTDALVPLGVALVAGVAFVVAQARGTHPMVPLDLLRSRAVVVASWTGFAFIGCWYGTVFAHSLYLQQERGLSSFAAGLVFVPATVVSGFVSVLTARLDARYGPRLPIVTGTLVMGLGLVALAAVPGSTPVWVLAALVVPVGICGPLAMQPTTRVLLESVPAHRSGVASGVFNTSRQLGGALAVAVCGSLVAGRADVLDGVRTSLLIAAAVALTAAAANLRTATSRH